MVFKHRSSQRTKIYFSPPRISLTILCYFIISFSAVFIWCGLSFAETDYGSYIFSTGTHWFSNCASGETGASGQSPGDKTGNEYKLSVWAATLSNGNPWISVFRYPDMRVAGTIAQLGIDAALNDNIGYDWGYPDRESYWNELRNVGYDPSAITNKCEADCSSAVCTNVRAAGYLCGIKALQTVTMANTATLTDTLTAAGFQMLTDDIYLNQKDYLLPGDILLASGHTLINVTKGSKAYWSEEPRVSVVTSTTTVMTNNPIKFTFISNKFQGYNGCYFDLYIWDEQSYMNEMEGTWVGVSGTKAIYTFSKAGTYYIKGRIHDDSFDIYSEPLILNVTMSPEPEWTLVGLTSKYAIVGAVTEFYVYSNLPQGQYGCYVDMYIWDEQDEQSYLNLEGGTWVGVNGTVATYKFTKAGTYYVKSCIHNNEKTVYSEPLIVRVSSDDSTPPTIVSYSFHDVTPNGYYVTVTATDENGVDFIDVGSWHEPMDGLESVWHAMTPDKSGTVTFYVSTAEFNNTTGVTYHTSAVVYDLLHNTTAVRVGNPFVPAASGPNPYAIEENKAFYLPSGLKEIDSEAFAGVSATYFIVPSSVHKIGVGAFPANSVVYLNTRNIDDLSPNIITGSGLFIETGTYYNDSFAVLVNNTESKYGEVNK